jgi:PAS domain-containing protein
MDSPTNRGDADAGEAASIVYAPAGIGRPDVPFPDDFANSIIYSNIEEVVYHLTVEGDGQYRFRFVNPAFEKATALPPSRVVGKLIPEVIPEPSCALVLAKYREAIDARATRHWEEVTEFPSGRKVGAVSVPPVFATPTRRCTAPRRPGAIS